jgi:hypothetical protein
VNKTKKKPPGQVKRGNKWRRRDQKRVTKKETKVNTEGDLANTIQRVTEIQILSRKKEGGKKRK